MFLRRSAKIDRGSGEIQRVGRMEGWAGRETENERPKFILSGRERRRRKNIEEVNISLKQWARGWSYVTTIRQLRNKYCHAYN